jgi:DDE superfamily endonuclease
MPCSALVQTLLPPASTSPSAQPDPLFPVLVLDESGFPKRGTHSAGVQPQYCGVSGRVENCQVGVFLSYVTAFGHGLIDRELYLPEDGCRDAPRRRAGHVPESLTFQTKPELALRMVQRTQQVGLPIRWVVADTVYGHSTDLRLWLEEQGSAYALAVPSIEVVAIQTHDGCKLSDVASLQQTLHRTRAVQGVVMAITQDETDVGGNFAQQSRSRFTLGNIGWGQQRSDGKPEPCDDGDDVQFPARDPTMPARFGPVRFGLNGGMGDFAFLPRLLMPDASTPRERGALDGDRHGHGWPMAGSGRSDADPDSQSVLLAWQAGLSSAVPRCDERESALVRGATRAVGTFLRQAVPAHGGTHAPRASDGHS